MDDNAMDDGHEQGASSRREFIRRGAIALGLGAWGVPLVQVVRSRGHGGGRRVETGTEEIGVQQVSAACTTCVVTCEEVTICGEAGIFACFCVPPADPYPIADCVCASDVFCEDATPCTEGCPPGWGCAQGCCEEPVCLPPCEEPAPIVTPEMTPFAARSANEPIGAGRRTVSGRVL